MYIYTYEAYINYIYDKLFNLIFKILVWEDIVFLIIRL